MAYYFFIWTISAGNPPDTFLYPVDEMPEDDLQRMLEKPSGLLFDDLDDLSEDEKSLRLLKKELAVFPAGYLGERGKNFNPEDLGIKYPIKRVIRC